MRVQPESHPYMPTARRGLPERGMDMWLLLTAATIVAGIIAAAVRRKRKLRAATHAVDEAYATRAIPFGRVYWQITGRQIPEVKHAALTPVGTERAPAISTSAAGPTFGTLTWLSIAGETGWTAADIWHDFAAINHDFYQAVSHLAGQQMDSIADLHQHLSAYEHGILGDVGSGVTNMLQGHVAEQVVADHLRELGHHVVLPDSPTQQGWDMLVDGHPFNVKNISDVSSLWEHMQGNGHIPVIVPDHVNGLPTDLPDIADPSVLLHAGEHGGIVVDHGLDHDTIVNQTHDAAQAALGHVDAHLPVITLLISSFREAKLLLNGRTEFDRSLKHIALDVAGTGVGAAVGAKAGALVGSVLLPGVGTVIGGIAGAICGAIFGRRCSNTVKRAPLIATKAAYERAHWQLQTRLVAEEHAVKATYAAAVRTEERRLTEMAETARRRMTSLVSASQSELADSAVLPATGARALASELEQMLLSDLGQAQRQIEALPFWRRYLLPDAATAEALARHKVSSARLALFHQLLPALLGVASWAATQKKLQSRSFTGLNPYAAHKLFQMTLAFGEGEARLEQYLRAIGQTLADEQAKVNAEIEAERIRLVEARGQAALALRDLLERMAAEARSRLEPLLSTLKSKQSQLKQEMGRHGLAVPE